MGSIDKRSQVDTYLSACESCDDEGDRAGNKTIFAF